MRKDIARLKKKIIPILKQHKIKRAGIFGSYARGEEKKSSDVDILAKIDKKVSLLGFVRIKNDLEKALGKKVDLVEYHLIKPRIKKAILDEEIKII